MGKDEIGGGSGELVKNNPTIKVTNYTPPPCEDTDYHPNLTTIKHATIYPLSTIHINIGPIYLKVIS